MQQIMMVLISIAVVIFFITNHFKEQKVDRRVFTPFLIFMVIGIIYFIKVKSLHSVVMSLTLRVLVGVVIGVLQGMLARLTIVNHEVFTKGTWIGMAFWLVFIPVRFLILPWFEMIAPGSINLNTGSYIGITALFIFVGFFLAKPVTLVLRKNSKLRLG